MTNITELLARAAEAAEAQPDDSAVAAVLKHGADARIYVWDAHFASGAERARLDEKLAASAPDFQLAVAATERALAEELADSSARRARIRAENPLYFKD
jgi:hypothetical protein